MTDNTQELDKALGYITMVWDESSVFGQPPDYSHIYLTGKQEAKEAILDWRDKQIEAELEALREEVKHEDLRTISQIITARIDKLKGSTE